MTGRFLRAFAPDVWLTRGVWGSHSCCLCLFLSFLVSPASLLLFPEIVWSCGGTQTITHKGLKSLILAWKWAVWSCLFHEERGKEQNSKLWGSFKRKPPHSVSLQASLLLLCATVHTYSTVMAYLFFCRYCWFVCCHCRALFSKGIKVIDGERPLRSLSPAAPSQH